MSTQVLDALQLRWGGDLDGAMRQQLRQAELDDSLAIMLSYALGLTDASGQTVHNGGGKRFRPLMCLLACEAVAGRHQEALLIASAIEMLHNFSLIHDDIEDRDDLRRHLPTVWKVWGERLAINAGDALFALASRTALLASQVPQEALLLARRFQSTSLTLTEGQHLDMSFEARRDVQPEEYLKMIEMKSASLIAFSAWAGGVTGGARSGDCERLWDFGLHLGRAFQIQDDILGLWAPSEVTGKQVAMDLVNRKKTLPVLLARSRVAPADAQLLRRFFGRKSEASESVMRVITSSGVRALCHSAIAEHLSSAQKALDATSLRRDGRTALSGLAENLVGHSG